MTDGRTAAYSAGNKVYGMGRPHPTSGPVDPTGYVERSRNKEASNRRSGLAAAATRRLQGTNPTMAQAPVPTPVGGGRATTGQQVSPQPSYAAPISLPDGRMVMANATGQYVFIENEV